MSVDNERLNEIRTAQSWIDTYNETLNKVYAERDEHREPDYKAQRDELLAVLKEINS